MRSSTKISLWTNADAKRAAKMGFLLHEQTRRINALVGGPFKSNAEAIEWVMWMAETGVSVNSFTASKYPELVEKKKTCRKAIYLACSGG